MIAFVAYAGWLGRNASTAAEAEGFDEMVTASFGASGGKALTYNLLAIVVGVGLLAGGSTLLVQGAVGIATALGVSETVIGLTIVAAGTSTPEGALTGGMLPKVACVRTALAGGVKRAHVISHKAPDSLLREVFTNEGAGTLIVPDSRAAVAAVEGK